MNAERYSEFICKILKPIFPIEPKLNPFRKLFPVRSSSVEEADFYGPSYFDFKD